MTSNKFYFLRIAVLLGLAYFALSSFVIKEEENEYLTIGIWQDKSSLQSSIKRGKNVYADFCVQCHLATGKGDLVNFPPLDGSDWLVKKRKQSIHAVKYGQTGEVVVKGKKFNNVMPPLGLENQEIADVMNYIMNSWSNKQMKMVTIDEVKAVIN